MSNLVTAHEASDQLLLRLEQLAPGWGHQRPGLRRRLADALADEPNQLLATMTYEEFLDWLDEDAFAEWEDGRVVVMSPPSLRHQLIVGFLSALLAEFVYATDGVVVSAPFQMKLSRVRRGREPDILFIAAAHRDRLKETLLDGPADLVVEVVSPESSERDRVTKYHEYAEAGVREYWIVDPQAHEAEFYLLNAASRRYDTRMVDEQGRYHAAVLPGFWLAVDWLWEDPLPSAMEILKQIKGS